MAETGVGFFFFILFVWVPAAALFFDASERRQSPYLWAALAVIPFFNVVVVGIYLVLRARASGDDAPTPTRLAAYLHIGVLTFWGVAAIGLNAAIYAPIRYLRAPAETPEFGNPRDVAFRETLAFALALLVIAVPALVAHLILLRRAVVGTAEGVRAQVGRMHRSLGMLLTVLGGLVVTLSVVILVFEGIGRLLSVGDPSVSASTLGMSALLPAALSIVGSLLFFRRAEGADEAA